MKAPVIPGHEFYGTVAELGEGAAEKYGLKIGDTKLPTRLSLAANADFV